MVTIQHTSHSLMRVEERTAMHENDILRLITANAYVELGTGDNNRPFVLFYDYFSSRSKIAILSPEKDAIISIWETDYYVPIGVHCPNLSDMKDARTKYHRYVVDRLDSTVICSAETEEDALSVFSHSGIWLEITTSSGLHISMVYLGPAPVQIKRSEIWLLYDSDIYDVCSCLETGMTEDHKAVVYVINGALQTIATYHTKTRVLAQDIENRTKNVSIYLHVTTESEEAELLLGNIRHQRSKHEKSIIRTQLIFDKLKRILETVTQDIVSIDSVRYAFLVENNATGTLRRFAQRTHTDMSWEIFELNSVELSKNEPTEVTLDVQVRIRCGEITATSNKRRLTLLDRLDFRVLIRIFKNEIVTLLAQLPTNTCSKTNYDIQILGYPNEPSIVLKPKTLHIWLTK